jgi:hypothetical protein
MPTDSPLLEAARLLTFRLARLSVDSIWARRSSGLRGSLLKEIDRLEILQAGGQTLDDEMLAHLDELVRRGFQIIEAAAREIRTIDDLEDIRRLLRK